MSTVYQSLFAKNVFVQFVRRTHTASLAAKSQLVFPPVCGECIVPSTCALNSCTPVQPVRSASTLNARPRLQQAELADSANASPEVFDYTAFFEEQLEKKRTTATYRVFRRILRDVNDYPFADDFSTGEPQRINVWCSNDYLGMSRHPKVRECARNAIDRFGVGSGGTRNISGNTLLHEALEHELASLHGKESGLVFTSCFVANEAALYTLGTLIPGLKVFSDAGNHASIIHGIRTSKAAKYIYRENDVGHLDDLMGSHASPENPKLAVCETVHSMSGDIVPLAGFLDVSAKHNALTFVDEVHAVGLYGAHGAGVAEELGCMHRIDAITGTLGKAFASIGGYLVGDRVLVDTIRSYAGGLIFTTSLPPPVLAAARASVAILASSEGRQLRAEHKKRVAIVRRRLQEAGLPAADVPSHIIPIFVGDAGVCNSISEDLLRNHQIYLQSINYPTVAKGTERLRLAPSPFHTDKMTDALVDSLVKVWRAHRLPLKH
ncbi:unnamed protein product [Mesocestoides corti]|uniref:5-aminolevulinate synthase n=1 Tax=Mesocestoides corti TaxID=53468 RepID=A0A0R3UN93_MESCO|nr:unnamed protein product [Mesocestoides corti]